MGRDNCMVLAKFLEDAQVIFWNWTVFLKFPKVAVVPYPNSITGIIQEISRDRM